MPAQIQPAARDGLHRRAAWPWPVGIAIAAIAMCLPFARLFVVLEDEGVLAHGAERLLHGQRIYHDFFEFLPPGGFVFVETWFRLTGVSVDSLRALAILTIAGIACCTFLAARAVSSNAPLAALLTVGWLTMTQGQATLLNHHWVTTLFAMAAVWASLEHGREPAGRWPWIAGLAAGAAAMTVPTRGALVALACLAIFAWGAKRSRAVLAFVLGGAAIPLALILWLAWHGSLASAFEDTILWPARNYTSIQYLPFGAWAGPRNLPIKFLFPAAAALALAVVATRRGHASRQTWRCAALAFAGFAGCFPRPDIFHIGFSVPLAYPLLAHCLSALTRGWRPAVLPGGVGWMSLPSAVAFLGVCLGALHGGTEMPTPRGRALWFGTEPGMPAMLARIAALPPADKFFFYPNLALAPVLTGREDVTKYDTYIPWYTRPAEYRDACRDAVAHADWLAIDRSRTDPATLAAVFPAMPPVPPRETVAFEAALDAAFALEAREGSLELRRRRRGISPALCDAIAP